MAEKRSRSIARAALVSVFAMCGGPVLSDESTPAANEAVEGFSPVFDVGIVVEDDPARMGLSGLMRAAATGDLRKIDRLVKEGANLDAQDVNGRTALSNAAGIGSTAVVERLLQHGADPNIVARDGRTALAYAIRESNVPMVKALLQGGSDPNGTIDRGGRSLLAYAAGANQESIVQLLLAANPILELDGVDVLNSVIWHGHEEITAMLLERGVSVNALTKNQQTVLHTAAERGSLNTVERLLQKGADVSATDRYGRTPLTVAITKGQAEIAERLIVEVQKGTVSDLQAALLRGQSTVAFALLEKMNLDALSNHQVSDILIAAERHENSPVLEHLLQLSAAKTFGNGAPQLVFVRSTPDSCRVDHWDVASDTQLVLYNENDACHATFHVEETTRSLFVVGKTDVKAISLDDGRVLFKESFPMDLVAQTARTLTKSWEEYWPGQNIAFDATLQVRGIGYTVDGELGFVANTTGPADGWYSFLFVRSDNRWRLTDEKNCHRFDGSCLFDEISGREIGKLDSRYEVWHPNVRLNPYFTDKRTVPESERSVDGENWSGTVRIVVDGIEVRIFHDAQEGEHCSDDCTYVRTIGVAIDDGEVSLVSNYAFGHWIVGSYLLVKPTRTEPFQLINLRNREVIFDDVRVGTWLF